MPPEIPVSRAAMGIRLHYVVGYIGSFNVYEGLETMIDGKRVLMSDVAPLADLAELSQNFSYFAKGDVVSLAK